MKSPDAIILVWLAVLNTMAFLAFGFDKWRAGRSGRRVSEFALVSLGALGGWPGGWLGMNRFRHKTAKASFRIKYALGFIPFAAIVWTWQRWR